MSIFNRTDTARVGYSAFDLSYSKIMTADLGYLYPVLCDMVVPGDRLFIGFNCVARQNPGVAPILHEVNIRYNVFFAPLRLLWPEPNGWESFITGGEDGTSAPTVPTWAVTDHSDDSLWAYLGFRVGTAPDADNRPVDFPRRAYAQIFNQYYRPEEIYAEIAETNESIMETTWEKDYFGACQTSQQRGVPPGIPINGVLDIDGKDSNITLKNTSDATARYMYSVAGTGASDNFGLQSSPSGAAAARWVDPALEVDLTSGASIDVAEVRLAFRIQEWMERNQRAGARYFEFLQSHFRIGGSLDARLDRCEFIGGAKIPIIQSEVLNTSAVRQHNTDTILEPQGSLAGHGIAVDQNFIGKYTVKEYGLVMGLMSIMPKAMYDTGGINRQWFMETNKDVYFPEFANLSEQAVLIRELTTGTVKADNESVFGYIGAWDHMRTKHDMAVGKMSQFASPNFEYWHIARQFTASSSTSINWTWLKGGANVRNDFLAVTAEPAYVVNWGNMIKAIRPMPVVAIPSILGA